MVEIWRANLSLNLETMRIHFSANWSVHPCDILKRSCSIICQIGFLMDHVTQFQFFLLLFYDYIIEWAIYGGDATNVPYPLFIDLELFGY